MRNVLNVYSTHYINPEFSAIYRSSINLVNTKFTNNKKLGVPHH